MTTEELFKKILKDESKYWITDFSLISDGITNIVMKVTVRFPVDRKVIDEKKEK